MKKKNLLKLIGTTALCSMLALGTLTGCATSTHGSATAPGYTKPVMNYENVLERGLTLKSYSTTYATEEKVLTFNVEADVYPLNLVCDVVFSIDSFSGGVFDNDNINISDYIEVSSSDRTATIKVKQAFLGGTVVIKAETSGIPNTLSETMTVKYEGIPTSLNVSCNGEKGSLENPIEIYANQTYAIDVDLDNYFDVIGNADTLTDFMYENDYVVLNGYIEAKVTYDINGVTDSERVKSNNLTNSTSIYFSDNLSELPGFMENELSVYLNIKYSDIVTIERPNRINENGQVSYNFSVSSASEFTWTKTWAELYPNREEVPSGYVKVEFDFSNLILNAGYNFSFTNTDYLRDVCYFTIIPTPTDIILNPDNIVL